MRYRVHGREYWDNNSGQNYRFSIGFGMNGEGLHVTRRVLGSGRDVVITRAAECSTTDPNGICVVALVRNREYVKHVELTYSPDDWATRSGIVPANWLQGPYEGDVEVWNGRIEAGSFVSDREKFAVRLMQAGSIAWDNAYDANFNCTRVGSEWACRNGALYDARATLPQN